MKIWTLLKNGDQHALLALYEQHYIGLANFGLRLTGNRELTNDCITQVLLHLWDKREHLPEVENVRAYLLTCLRRELLAERHAETIRSTKARILQLESPQEEISYEEHIVRLQTNSETKARLSRAFEILTGRERELLRLRFFEDLDYDAIALQCGISKRTAYNIIHHALKTLRKEFSGDPKLQLIKTPVILPFMLFLLL